MDEEKKLEWMKRRRITFSKILLVISIAYFIVLMLIILAIYYFGVGYTWVQQLQLSLQNLALIGCIMYLLFILFEILLYIDYRNQKKKVEELKKPKPLYYKGKRLLVYTHPKGTRGGIFSRTIIPVDSETFINLRYQMVKPEELWGEEKNQ
ncbi:MAG TPA: hypothetical protein ENI42_03780 [Thermoplasmatales archaeon]|nr:hypothetical protein [Thermoplasmatales archaeon]